jgi:PAS domain S-box-containing protein
MANPRGMTPTCAIKSALENVVNGIITIDERGHIESFNAAAEKIFGYMADEVTGQNINCLMPAPYHEEHDSYLHNYLTTGNAKIIGIGREVTGQHKNGTTFPLDLAVSEFSQGNKRMFTGIVRDITERKQLEAQLVQAQKMESVGQLAGGVAHDFNNQLGIVLFDLDMMLAVREDLLKIRKVILRAANLTRQLLLFSRRQQIERQPLDLNGQTHELQKMLERLLGERIIEEMDLEKNLWTINADPGNMDQVVLNLTINSRDAMPEGGSLRLATCNVMVDEVYCRQHSQARPGRFVRLEVSGHRHGYGRSRATTRF